MGRNFRHSKHLQKPWAVGIEIMLRPFRPLKLTWAGSPETRAVSHAARCPACCASFNKRKHSVQSYSHRPRD